MSTRPRFAEDRPAEFRAQWPHIKASREFIKTFPKVFLRVFADNGDAWEQRTDEIDLLIARLMVCADRFSICIGNHPVAKYSPEDGFVIVDQQRVDDLISWPHSLRKNTNNQTTSNQ